MVGPEIAHYYFLSDSLFCHLIHFYLLHNRLCCNRVLVFLGICPWCLVFWGCLTVMCYRFVIQIGTTQKTCFYWLLAMQKKKNNNKIQSRVIQISDNAWSGTEPVWENIPRRCQHPNECDSFVGIASAFSYYKNNYIQSIRFHISFSNNFLGLAWLFR